MTHSRPACSEEAAFYSGSASPIHGYHAQVSVTIVRSKEEQSLLTTATLQEASSAQDLAQHLNLGGRPGSCTG